MKKKSKIAKSDAIIILVIVIITIGLASVFIWFEVKPDKTDSPKTTEYDEYYAKNSDKVNLEMTKNIEYKDYLLVDGNILVEIRNNNDYPITSKIYVEFTDSDKRTIMIEEAYVSYIKSGGKSYACIRVNEELRKMYKSYEVKAIAEYNNTSIKSYEDNIKLVSFNEDAREIKFKNNSKKKIDSIQWGILYYDENNKVVGYDEVYSYDVKAFETVTEKFYLPNMAYSRAEAILLYGYRYR